MPKNLPDNVQIAKNSMEIATPWITLLEITVDGQLLRLCNNNEDITFEGNLYEATELQISTIKQSVGGKIPSLNINISNVTRAIEPYVDAANGLIESTVKLIIINTGLLTENYAELTMDFSVMGAEVNNKWITFTLGAPSPMRERFPPDRYIAYSCPWTFNSPDVRASGDNTGAECAYTGAFTSCDKTFAACQVRNNTSRFGGFFGLRDDTFRVA